MGALTAHAAGLMPGYFSAASSAARAVDNAAVSATVARSQFLPPDDIRALLDGATHFSEFVAVPAGSSSVDAYVSYPDRREKSPAVLLSVEHEGMSDWLRAAGARLSRSGFIAVVADRAAGANQAVVALRSFATQIPAATGTVATLEFSKATGRMSARVERAAGSREKSFSLDETGWRSVVSYLQSETNNRYEEPAVDLHAYMVHAEHMAAAAQRGTPGRAGGEGGPGGSPMASKRADLPPHLNLAARTLAESPRKGEWVDIPMGNAKIRTWVVYPTGTGPAPIIVNVHGSGYGFGDWVRAVGDQLAQEGFISLTPDLLSGLGPKGGNSDAFEFPDDVTRSMGRLGSQGALERVKAVRNYGMKLPRANGKSSVIGYCSGGGQAFLMAAEPGVNAGVVYYGGAPSAEVMSKVTAPVIGFYGEDDARLTASVEPTAAAMKKLGKVYEPHIYRDTTHGFLTFQDLGDNFQSTADSWGKAIAFLKRHAM
jgi:carboxymethylenebutenolidase